MILIIHIFATFQCAVDIYFLYMYLFHFGIKIVNRVFLFLLLQHCTEISLHIDASINTWISYQKCSLRKDGLRNFAKFRGKHLYQSLFFDKVAVELCSFIRKRSWRRCFPLNFWKFLRTPFSQNTSGWLLLNFYDFCQGQFMMNN